MSVIIRGNLLNFLVTGMFMFSTMYGLLYLYNMGVGTEINAQELKEMDPDNPTRPEQNWWSGIITGTFDQIFEAISIFNPFFIIKSLLQSFLPDILYTMMNLFLLRPIGVIVTFMEVDYIFNMLRGKSE